MGSTCSTARPSVHRLNNEVEDDVDGPSIHNVRYAKRYKCSGRRSAAEFVSNAKPAVSKPPPPPTAATNVLSGPGGSMSETVSDVAERRDSILTNGPPSNNNHRASSDGLSMMMVPGVVETCYIGGGDQDHTAGRKCSKQFRSVMDSQSHHHHHNHHHGVDDPSIPKLLSPNCGNQSVNSFESFGGLPNFIPYDPHHVAGTPTGSQPQPQQNNHQRGTVSPSSDPLGNVLNHHSTNNGQHPFLLGGNSHFMSKSPISNGSFSLGVPPLDRSVTQEYLHTPKGTLRSVSTGGKTSPLNGSFMAPGSGPQQFLLPPNMVGSTDSQ